MSKPNTGGAAFPRPYGEAKTTIKPGISNTWSHSNPQPGMTIRQYYKAKAVEGLVISRGKRWSEDFCDEPDVLADIAKFVGKLADALIAEDEEFEKRGAE